MFPGRRLVQRGGSTSWIHGWSQMKRESNRRSAIVQVLHSFHIQMEPFYIQDGSLEATSSHFLPFLPFVKEGKSKCSHIIPKKHRALDKDYPFRAMGILNETFLPPMPRTSLFLKCNLGVCNVSKVAYSKLDIFREL